MLARTPSPMSQAIDSPRSAAGDEAHSVNITDVATRLRFSNTARVSYTVCVVVAACLILVTPTKGVDQWWYWSIEGLLTLLFVGEICIKMLIQGPIGYLTHSRANQAEAGVCLLCVILFFASILGNTHRSEENLVEAVLITLRYLALLGRLCFFVRSTSVQTVSSGRVEVRCHDNHHIGVGAGVGVEMASCGSLQRLDRFESTVWDDEDSHHDDMRKEFLTQADEETAQILEKGV